MTTFISTDEMLLYLQGTSIRFHDCKFFLADHVLVDVINQVGRHECAAAINKLGYAILQDANIELQSKEQLYKALRSSEETGKPLSSVLDYRACMPVSAIYRNS